MLRYIKHIYPHENSPYINEPPFKNVSYSATMSENLTRSHFDVQKLAVCVDNMSTF